MVLEFTTWQKRIYFIIIFDFRTRGVAFSVLEPPIDVAIYGQISFVFGLPCSPQFRKASASAQLDTNGYKCRPGSVFGAGFSARNSRWASVKASVPLNTLNLAMFFTLDKSDIIVQTKRKINNTTLSEEEFEYIKGVIRIRKSKKGRQHNGQKKKGQQDKQRSTQYYTEN